MVAFLNVFIFIINDAYGLARMLTDQFPIQQPLFGNHTKFIRRLDLEKLFLAIDVELEPIGSRTDEDPYGSGDKNPLLDKSRVDDLPPELLFVDSLRRGAIQKAEISRNSLKPNSTQMIGYVPLHRKKKNSESEEDTATDVFAKIFDKHKAEFEKNFEKIKQIFLENLKKGFNSIIS